MEEIGWPFNGQHVFLAHYNYYIFATDIFSPLQILIFLIFFTLWATFCLLQINHRKNLFFSTCDCCLKTFLNTSA